MAFTKTEVDLQLGGCFAGIHIHDSAAGAQSIANGVTYTKVTGFDDNDASRNCTSDSANDKITITVAGVYKVEAAISFTGTGNSVSWFGTVFLDGVEKDPIHFQRKIGVGGDFGSAPLSGEVVVSSVPVDLDFRIRHDDTVSRDFTMTYGNLNVFRLGAEES
jgi:hypothetical protein